MSDLKPQKVALASDSDFKPQFELQDPAGFRKRLRRWYAAAARDLPWRRTHDPYAIWISEIMLQQTQVATVLDYYARFLERFPSVTSLAEAEEEEVLSYWSGLGYYRRARQLLAAAKKVALQHGGEFPTELEHIADLPGIGRYTAAAVHSFATDGRSAIVEANTARLYSRLMGLEQDVSVPATQKLLWSFAESVIPSRGGGTGLCNQALIELGNQVCTPKSPGCDECPVKQHCRAFELGLQARIPPPKKKKSAEQLVHAMVVIRCGDQVLLRQNEVGEWWQGLWEFARVDMTMDGTKRRKLPASGKTKSMPLLSQDCVRSGLSQRFALECHDPVFQTQFSHAVTRYRIRLECFTVEAEQAFATDELEGTWKWCSSATLDAPLSAPSQRLHRLLLD